MSFRAKSRNPVEIPLVGAAGSFDSASTALRMTAITNNEFTRRPSRFATRHAERTKAPARWKQSCQTLGIIRDGGMLIRDGKIERVGPSDEIEKNAGDAEVVDAGGRVVMPGFVDAHTHLVFAGNRLDDFERRARGETYEQIAKAGGGIWSTVEKTRAASEARSSRAGKETCELVPAMWDHNNRSQIWLRPDT